MKRCGYFLILMVAIALVSCNSNVVSSADINNVKFTAIKSKTVYLLDSTDNNSPKHETDISIEFAESEEMQCEKNINNSILYAIFGYENLAPKVAIDSFISHTHSEYANLYPEYLNEKQINKNAVWLNYSYIIRTRVEYGYKDIINYIIHSEHFSGGANPNAAYTIINFDPETGNEIKLNDIFKDNYEEYLCNRLTDALAKKIGAKDIEDIKKKGYLTFNDIYPTENFIIKKDSILFYYNTYEIGPRSTGTTVLGFTHNDLSTIIK